jgi:hypothetical protein
MVRRSAVRLEQPRANESGQKSASRSLEHSKCRHKGRHLQTHIGSAQPMVVPLAQPMGAASERLSASCSEGLSEAESVRSWQAASCAQSNRTMALHLLSMQRDVDPPPHTSRTPPAPSEIGESAGVGLLGASDE